MVETLLLKLRWTLKPGLDSKDGRAVKWDKMGAGAPSLNDVILSFESSQL